MDCSQAESLYVLQEEAREQEIQASASSFEHFEEVAPLETIYTAIAAANNKYEEIEIGSGDRDPIDPPYQGVGPIEPISTGYGVPRAEPLGVYTPLESKRSRRRSGGNNRRLRP